MTDEFLGVNDATLSSSGLGFLADGQILIVCRRQVGQLLVKLVVFDLVRLEDAGLVSTRREGEEEVLQQHGAGSGHTFIGWFKVTMPRHVFSRRTTVLPV